MKKRARPISDDLTRQANEYGVALASDKHSTLRERRTTRSNSLLSGAPFFVFSIDFINFCAGFSQAAKPVWHFDCVWRTRKAVDSRPCEPLLFRSACILSDLPPGAARGLTVELSIEGFTDRAAACPERHINDDRSFCLCHHTPTIRSMDEAKVWWQLLHRHLSDSGRRSNGCRTVKRVHIINVHWRRPRG